jgi:hypothetical protein
MLRIITRFNGETGCLGPFGVPASNIAAVRTCEFRQPSDHCVHILNVVQYGAVRMPRQSLIGEPSLFTCASVVTFNARKRAIDFAQLRDISGPNTCSRIQYGWSRDAAGMT